MKKVQAVLARLLHHRRIAIIYTTHNMLCTRSMRLLVALAAVAAVSCPTSVFADWQSVSSSTQSGPVRSLLVWHSSHHMQR